VAPPLASLSITFKGLQQQQKSPASAKNSPLLAKFCREKKIKMLIQ